MKTKLSILFLLLCLMSITSCFEDDIDDNLIATTEINDFIWKSMNLWYFWQGDESIPELDDDNFASNSDYIDYLNAFASPEDLFNNLKFSGDRFSIITNDYVALLNALQGTTISNGMEYALALVGSTTNVVGIVEYVLPNSSASNQGIMRGDIFSTVNSTQLTESNFEDLLFGVNDTYTIGLANVTGDTIQLTGTTFSLAGEELTENPVFLSNVFDVGTIKVGYLMYNAFNSNFETELNAVFSDFGNEGVDELVLDLRYNSGGSVGTTTRLASMISGQPTNNVFYSPIYNTKIPEIFPGIDDSQNFVSTIGNGNAINSLNLNKVYILTEGGSASASELLINGLDPYIDVVHIGNTTRGKNEFSSVIFDIPDCAYISFEDCDVDPNPNHTYAMLLLLGRNANADGFFDYTAGIEPDILFPEDLANLGVLGEVDEPLLARAIQHISGGGRSTIIDSNLNDRFKILKHTSTESLIKNNMYIDLPKDVRLTN